MAERVGFEPTRPKKGLPVFETGPFNRSGTSPHLSGHGSKSVAERVGFEPTVRV